MTSANRQANIRFFMILSSRFLAEHILPQFLRKKKEASLFDPVFVFLIIAQFSDKIKSYLCKEYFFRKSVNNTYRI